MHWPSFALPRVLKLLVFVVSLALIGMIPAPTASAAITITGLTCSSVTFTSTYANGRRTTNPVTTTCSGTGTITISGVLYINGTRATSASNTCYAASSCTLGSMSATANQNDTWRATASSNLTGVTCSGPAATSSYVNGQRVTNAIRVTCTGTGTITVSGVLYINGVQKDSDSATCYSANACTLPSMSAPANQSDTWRVTY
ncbi:MAG TPA: hypothetical protein VFS21_15965 [Roseiflexaceae bacterium]|nr:hypothetical protein [Roseiflexaceae bacterium]